MTVYLFLATAFLIFFLMKESFSTKIISVGLLVAVYSLKGLSVGADTGAYFYAYSNNLGYGGDWAYNALSSLCNFLGLGYNSFLFVLSFFLFVPLSYVYYKHSKNFYVSLMAFMFLMCFFWSLGVVRQGVAMAWVMLSYSLIVLEKRYWAGICASVVGVLFHLSSILFISVYFLLNSNNKVYISWILLVVLMSFVDLPILNFFYSHYAEGRLSFQAQPRVQNLIFYIVISLILGLYLLSNALNDGKYEDKNFLRCILLALALAVWSVKGRIFYRLSNYSIELLTIYIPHLFVGMNSRTRTLLLFIFFICGSLGMYYFGVFSASETRIYPYVFLDL